MKTGRYSKNDDVELTVGITTCCRPEAIRKCISSIEENIKVPHKIVVVDNSPNNSNIELYKTTSNLDYIVPKDIIGPSASRKLIVESCKSEYLLFLDDDNMVKKRVVERMMSYIKNNDVAAVSGIWLQASKFGNIGHYFVFGEKNSKKYVIKAPLNIRQIREIGLDSVKVHSSFNTIMFSTKVFDEINFDSRYDFFYEWWDLFMQCYMKDFSIVALTNAEFLHEPIKYQGPTIRKNQEVEKDKMRFIEKWGFVPVDMKKRRSSIFSFLFRTL